MIVLDTNVVSALMRREPDSTVRRWLDDCPSESIWLTAVTIFEIRFGLETLSVGRRRQQLESDFSRLLAEDFQGRILHFDDGAAEAAARLAARRKPLGRVGELRDTLIAGIVISRKAELATRNVRHFQDLEVSVIGPWQDEG
jgi:predicted nucleic acid-binding protein